VRVAFAVLPRADTTPPVNGATRAQRAGLEVEVTPL
jgi:hypothetical protein